MRLRHITAALLLLAAPLWARAESHDDETAALGYQTEHATLVLLAEPVDTAPGTAGSPRTVTFSVLSALRGERAGGDRVTVLYPDLGLAPPWVEGERHLIFLEPAGATPDRWQPVSGTLGIRVIPRGSPRERFVEMVRSTVRVLGEGTQVAEPAALRTLLVDWMDDRDPAVVWSAATDFVRHRELHAELSDDDALRVVEAFRRHPFGRRSRQALAMAAAVTGREAAAKALVECLGTPGGATIRGTVADALQRMRHRATQEMLLDLLRRGPPESRATVTQVVGRICGNDAAPPVAALLVDPSAEVRLEAAHALGRIARTARAADPEDRIDVRGALHALVLVSDRPAERKAGLWALAQLDDPQGYAILRKLAKEDGREDVRRHAARYLERPRVSLIL